MNFFYIVFNGLLLLTIAYAIWKRSSSPLRKVYWPAFLLKITAGLLLGLIYSAYYSDSDTFYFFQEATDAALIARTDFSRYVNYFFTETEGYFMGEARVNFMIKLVSIFCLLTADNYWLITVYFACISFFIAWWLTCRIAKYFNMLSAAGCIAFLFFPSCVFWSAGILKETVAVVSLYLVAGIFISWWCQRRVHIIEVFVFLFAAWAGWSVKYYYVGLFIPVLLSAWCARAITERLNQSRIHVELVLMFILLGIGVWVAGFLHPNLSLTRIAGLVVSNYEAFIAISNPEDVIHYQKLSPTVFSLLANSPWALVSGLFRPFIWEASNLMQVLASLENTFLLVLFILAIPQVTRIKQSPHRILIIAILIYSAALCVFLALSSPNFGTLVRYRVSFLPFLVLLLLHKSFLEKIFIGKILK